MLVKAAAISVLSLSVLQAEGFTIRSDYTDGFEPPEPPRVGVCSSYADYAIAVEELLDSGVSKKKIQYSVMDYDREEKPPRKHVIIMMEMIDFISGNPRTENSIGVHVMRLCFDQGW